MKEKPAHDKLIHRYFDDTLDATDEAELLQSLAQSAEARRQFVSESFLNHDLRDVMREADIRSFIAGGTDDLSDHAGGRVERVRRVRLLWISAAIAASVLIASAYAIFSRGPEENAPGVSAVANGTDMVADPTEDVAVDSEPVASRRIVSVGTIVQQKGCKWAGGRERRNGDSLPPKTVLSLLEGAAEVTLENGVRLVLAGPCELDLVSEMRGKLYRGSVTARVPSAAHGYTLSTPSSQVIDLGTEFGISVDVTGESEVHVFEGEVVSRWSGENGKAIGHSLRLREKHAARYGLIKRKRR